MYLLYIYDLFNKINKLKNLFPAFILFVSLYVYSAWIYCSFEKESRYQSSISLMLTHTLTHSQQTTRRITNSWWLIMHLRLVMLNLHKMMVVICNVYVCCILLLILMRATSKRSPAMISKGRQCFSDLLAIEQVRRFPCMYLRITGRKTMRCHWSYC